MLERLLGRRRAVREDFKQTFLTSDHGRRVLGRLLVHCGMRDSSFRSDAGLMAYAEGRRAIGLIIQRALYLSDEETYRVMADAKIADNDSED